MRYLREKIDRPFGVESLETVRGAGYRLRKDGGVLSRLPIRVRLTAAFALAMVVVLVAAALFVYLRLARTSTSRSTRGCERRATRPPRGCAASGPGRRGGSSGGVGEAEESFAQVLSRRAGGDGDRRQRASRR